MSLALFLAAAASFADLDTIDRQVAAFTGAPIGAAGGATQGLDRRLRLRPCYAPLALAWRGQTRDTVVAECPDAGGWRLFVPVRACDWPLQRRAIFWRFQPTELVAIINGPV